MTQIPQIWNKKIEMHTVKYLTGSLTSTSITLLPLGFVAGHILILTQVPLLPPPLLMTYCVCFIDTFRNLQSALLFCCCLCFDFFCPFSKGLSQLKSKFMQEVKSVVKRSWAIFHGKLVKLRKHNNSCRKETCLGFEVKTNKTPDKISEKRQKKRRMMS
jgi:hypothetical protein